MIKKIFERKGAYVFSLLMGMLFVFICRTGRDLAASGDISWTGEYIIATAGIILLGGLAVGTLCFLLLSVLCLRLPEEWQEVGAPWGVIFGGSFLLIFVSKLPGWLAYWPGIAAYDSPVQLGQVFGGSYNEHHPLAHTLLIKGCMDLGTSIFGTTNAGIAIYTLLQLLLISGALAFGVASLRRSIPRKAGTILTCFCQILFMLSPFSFYLDISVTKDITFTAFFLVAVVSLGLILKGFKDVIYYILLFVGAFGSILFRNNGIYAWGAAWVVMLIVFIIRRFKAPLGLPVLELAVAIVLGRVVLSLLFNSLGAVQGDRREMLSVPIQQIARTAYYHADEISSEDMAVVDEFLLDGSYMEYQPSLSDPVKRHTNTYVVRYRTAEFAKTYLNLFRKYPGDYINAVLTLDAGYLYPGDETHAFVNVKEGTTGMGYIQTHLSEELDDTGICYEPVFHFLHGMMEDWADQNAYLNIPVLKYLFMPGIYVWLYVLLILAVMIRRQCMNLLTLLPLAAYYGTLLLGPGVQLRYIYPLMVILPIITCVIIGRDDDRT